MIAQGSMAVNFVLRLDPTPHCDDFIVSFFVRALSIHPPSVMDTVSLFKATKQELTSASKFECTCMWRFALVVLFDSMFLFDCAGLIFLAGQYVPTMF